MLSLLVRERFDPDRALFSAAFLTHIAAVLPRDDRPSVSIESFRSMLEHALASHGDDDGAWRALYRAVRLQLADACGERVAAASWAYLAAFVRENGDLG